jgi:hypothetical protein
MSSLREFVWRRDEGVCQRCFKPCAEDDWDLAHKKGKRMWGDSPDNTEVAHQRCHRIIQHCNGGVEKIVPEKRSLRI